MTLISIRATIVRLRKINQKAKLKIISIASMICNTLNKLMKLNLYFSMNIVPCTFLSVKERN